MILPSCSIRALTDGVTRETSFTLSLLRGLLQSQQSVSIALYKFGIVHRISDHFHRVYSTISRMTDHPTTTYTNVLGPDALYSGTSVFFAFLLHFTRYVLFTTSIHPRAIVVDARWCFVDCPFQSTQK